MMLATLLASCEMPDSEQIEFRDAILVKTSREDPTIESGSPIRVYRFEENLGSRENKRR
jgi:hypothetical protein